MGTRGFGFAASLIVAGLFVLSACSGGTSPPEASFTVEGESGAAPLGVQFTDTSAGSVDSWGWDFGDGSTSTEQNPVHEYTEAGSFTVSLAVVNSAGNDEVTVPDAVAVEPGDLVDVVAGGDLSVVVVESAQLEASAVDEFGNEIDDVEFVWAMVGSTGTVDADGLFTAGTEAGVFAGLVEVTATAGSNSATSTLDVTIEPGLAVEVAVQPSEATVAIGGTESFAVVGMDEFGNEISDLAASWSLNAGSGEVDSDGVYTAGTTAGAFAGEIVADVSEAGSASADVVIPPDAVAVIDVQPGEVIVGRGDTATFAAVGADQYGNVVPDLTIAWSTTGGEIDPAGTFTATVPGDHEVTATASAAGGGEANGSASALVPPNYPDFVSTDGLSLVGSAGPVDGFLRLTPALSELAAGGAWTTFKVPVVDGFDTTFTFRLSGDSQSPGNGLAFVIQTAGDGVLGEPGSGIGYKRLPGSVAVEIDTLPQDYEVDIPGTHISVNTQGQESNTSHHSASVGGVVTSIPPFVPGPVITDGAAHTVRIVYRPGIMDVYLDNLDAPLMTVWIDLAEELNIESDARVGFTAGTEPAGFTDNHDILNWTFGPLAESAGAAPQPPPPEAFDGVWFGADADGSQVTATIECCDRGVGAATWDDTRELACDGPSRWEGTARLVGAVLNVEYHTRYCIGRENERRTPFTSSFFLQPDGTMIDSLKIVFRR